MALPQFVRAQAGAHGKAEQQVIQAEKDRFAAIVKAARTVREAEAAGTELGPRFHAYLDTVFEAYGRMYEPMEAFYRERFPKDPSDSDFVYRSTITAKTCDTLRMLLPAATRSNLGIYATGQSYEQLLMRLAAHPLAEMREYGDLMKFTAASSSSTAYALTWDFDNTESGSDNTQAGNTGQDGSHQFSGLDTVAKIQTVRHVKATATVNAALAGASGAGFFASKAAAEIRMPDKQ